MKFSYQSDQGKVGKTLIKDARHGPEKLCRTTLGTVFVLCFAAAIFTETSPDSFQENDDGKFEIKKLGNIH